MEDSAAPSGADSAGKRGRPRSEPSHLAVLRATAELLQEGGLRSVTTDQIAARSGVSKKTIYKWWPNKFAVALEACLSDMIVDLRDPDTGSAATDLRIVLRELTAFHAGADGRVLAQLIGEAQFDQSMRTDLHKHLMLAHRDTVRRVWARGVAEGQFRSDIDPDAAVDVLIAPLLYRHLVGHPHLDSTATDELVEITMRGLSAQP